MAGSLRNCALLIAFGRDCPVHSDFASMMASFLAVRRVCVAQTCANSANPAVGRWPASVICLTKIRMKTLDEIIGALRRMQPELRRRYPIREMGVFGSYARGEQTEESDLDVFVSLGEGIGLVGLAGLQQDLTDALGVKVDLVMKGSLKRRIGQRILFEAVML
jgi:uncharacterized protein